MDARRTARLAVWVGSAALTATATACGARSGVELAAAEAAWLDAGARDDARFERPDASVPSCPAPSTFGFDVVPMPPLVLDVSPGEISLGGDGARVLLAASSADGRAPGVLAELGARGELLATSRFERVRRPRLAVDAGTFRLLGLRDDARLALLTGTGALRYETATTTIFRGPLATFGRPAWNGEHVVVAGDNGFELFLGAFEPGGVSVPWLSLGPAEDVAVAAQAASGETELVFRAADRTLSVTGFARDGAQLWPTPPGSQYLEEIGFRAGGAVALGWLDGDGTGQPIVVAGFSSEEGRPHATLRRFRRDGAAAAGFSAPLGGMPGGIDLTTVAPPGHAHGYGMVASSRDGETIFHGAGEDFVGDARPVPLPCDGEHVSIAAGPCGYVIACLGAGRVHTALVVPPLPR